jgi:hypothetical protein
MKKQLQILHNDLKLTNVFENGTKEYLYKDGSHCIQDVHYKCLVGLVGIGFWRALEIFQQLNNKVPMSKIAFINKCNVYSYYMTCYRGQSRPGYHLLDILIR